MILSAAGKARGRPAFARYSGTAPGTRHRHAGQQPSVRLPERPSEGQPESLASIIRPTHPSRPLPAYARYVARAPGVCTSSTTLHSAIYVTKAREAMRIDKSEIIAALRAKGLDARADWVDRQLPQIVDTYDNGALLQMLEIDLSTMSPVDVAPQQN